MAMPLRSHRNGGTTERRLGWARNPLTEFDELLTQMSGLLETTVGGAASAAAWAPTRGRHRDRRRLRGRDLTPWCQEKDIDVEANGRDLVVTGEINEKERKGVLRRGTRRTGAFEHRLRLPVEVDAEKVTVDMSAGVLTVTDPQAPSHPDHRGGH
jgi:HSP20 family protein